MVMPITPVVWRGGQLEIGDPPADSEARVEGLPAPTTTTSPVEFAVIELAGLTKTDRFARWRCRKGWNGPK